MLRLTAAFAVMAGAVLVLLSYFNGHVQLRQVGARIDQVRAEQRARELEAIKERYWTATYRAPADCGAAATALRALECRNHRDVARRDFERQWGVRIASGWAPSEPAPDDGNRGRR